MDNPGYGRSPRTIAPVNAVDRARLPEGLQDRKHVAREVGLEVSGAGLNRDAGFDSQATRKGVCKAGLTPNRKENPRHRPTPKRGRPRCFAAGRSTLRVIVERPFAWEDQGKRLLRRFETKQLHPLGVKLLAFTLINLREFCGG